MKIQSISFLFALAISILFAFSCYGYTGNSFKEVYAATAFFSSLLIFVFLLSAQFRDSRLTINIKAVSVVAVLIEGILFFLFNNAERTPFSFLIAVLFFLIVYLGILYFIVKSKIS